MIYLKSFDLLSIDQEHSVYYADERTIHKTYYPIGIFSMKELKEVIFDDITIFYGGNGSGKTTLLNIIAEKLQAQRKNSFNKGNIFNIYVSKCNYKMSYDEPMEIKIVSSDDVFDYLLDIRSINSSVDRRKEKLSKEYIESKYNTNSNFEDYEDLKRKADARKKSMSQFVRDRLLNNTIEEHSNGESALMFWEKEIKENAIYILDEPENSLSAENQIKLKQFIEDSVRFYNCQFIISTHSPFLLNLNNAKIYDLDESPVIIKKWTELKNVKLYYNFFKEKENEFM